MKVPIHSSELSELLVDAREAAWRRLAAVVVATAAAAADARAACWGSLDARYLRLPHRLHRCAAPNPRRAHAAPKTALKLALTTLCALLRRHDEAAGGGRSGDFIGEAAADHARPARPALPGNVACFPPPPVVRGPRDAPCAVRASRIGRERVAHGIAPARAAVCWRVPLLRAFDRPSTWGTPSCAFGRT